MNDRSAFQDDLPNAPSQHGQREQRVSTLVGDRLCTSCGYNLTGQPVVREPHYAMLIVRCPECGTVASVQEYPLLGRWANRWAALAAASWFFVLMVIWVGGGAAIFGLAVGSAELASERYVQFVWSRWNQWQSAQSGPNAGSGAMYDPIAFEAWWVEQSGSLWREAGGWIGAMQWHALVVWIFLALVAFILGCVWAVALLGRRRIELVALSVAVMAMAAAFSLIMYVEWWGPQRLQWYHLAARSEIAPTVMAFSLVLGWMALIGGMLAGRSVVRCMIRLLLPPRLRSSLATLWLADGLAPPRTR